MTARNELTLAIALAIILLASIGSAAQDSRRESSPQPTATREHRDDAALKDDIQKMRAILNQMQSNLAFVGNTTTPLNHQFELEIDMWRTLLNHMERTVDGAAPPRQPPQRP